MDAGFVNRHISQKKSPEHFWGFWGYAKLISSLQAAVQPIHPHKEAYIFLLDML